MMTTQAVLAVGRRGRTKFVAGIVLLLVASSCDRIWPREPDLTLPPIEVIRAAFRDKGIDADIDYNGNTVELHVAQPADQLRRGGSLWARVGPWIYLFSPATEQVFENYPGVVAVRVITTSRGRQVARVTLRNGILSDVLWRRSLNILGHALQDGTRDPGRLEELAEWGERHGEYEYSPRYVPVQ